MLDELFDAMRVRQYFNAVTAARDLVSGVRDDAAFLDAVRYAVMPLPFEHRERPVQHPFPELRVRSAARFRSRRVALLATGGSGALASVVGAARAMEECGVPPAVISLCSGSALFGFPLAAGRSADEVADFTLHLRPADLVDLNWPALLKLGPTLGRGFTGFLRGEKLEATYAAWLGDMTLAEMPIPAYAPVWSVEHNRVDFVGPRTHPDMTVARAVRMAVALPLFIEAVVDNGEHYYDGGTADILPVRPLLDIEPVPDAVLAVNGFYPPEFAGDDASGWVEKRGSIFHAAAQVRSIQHLQLARENLERLRREVPDVMLINPVPYATIRGVGLYRQFVDSSRWAEFMSAGRRDALEALRHRGPAPARATRARKGALGAR